MSGFSIKHFIYLILSFAFFFSCQPEKETQFVLLEPDQTGIDFKNELVPSPELNIFNYLYFYDGAGVATGDVTGNGLPDLYFASNQSENRLYINKGNFIFEDVTNKAFDIITKDWTTGVTFVDINNDGLLDIYVSNVGGYLHLDGQNQLYINQGVDHQGIPQFIESAEKFGLNLQGLATQAVFFDYDRDGDLDMYMLNHSVHSLDTFTYSTLRKETSSIAGDRLMRNDNGYFVDVTEEAGIYSSPLGYGLGIGITDFTGNGYPDIYVGNDFHEDDYLYLNNGDGTFTESLENMILHTSYSSMGNDLVDFNNDGLIDIVSLDMLPQEYKLQKTTAGEDSYEIYNMKLSYGYKHKFTRNTLQLNRGGGRFSEIGMLLGVDATDWSWAALGADFNNNGYNDLFISNGIYGRTNELDYISFITQENIQEQIKGDLSEEDLKLAEKAPAVKIPNYMYKNNGHLNFTDVSVDWGIDNPTFSSGAVYVDLNGNGALDLVVNNVNQVAGIYKNRLRDLFPKANYLKIDLKGPEENKFGIGTKVILPRKEKEDTIIRELYTVRGFQSSVEPILHIGLDSLDIVDELTIKWPDGKTQVIQNINVNQMITVHYTDAQFADKKNQTKELKEFLYDITNEIEIDYEHEENEFVEFNREPLIPHMVSREGPAIAVGDVNGNGLDDLFVGGAKRQKGSLFIQQENEMFTETEIPDFEKDFIYEDVDAHFEDFNNNGYLDLLVISGGNEYSGTSEYMMPRIYVNDGEGNFIRGLDQLPEIYLTGSVAAIADANGNGYPDIFIGARAVPWNYGEKPVSYLLKNNGEGVFEIDTSEFGKKVADSGLVTGAVWADMDLDGNMDLVIASEWSEIKIFYNDSEFTVEKISGSSGLWNTISVTDLNHNGRPDILAGNLGLNSKFKASQDKPLRMYFNDFDNNGLNEQIITYVDENGEERLFATKDELSTQLPFINERFHSYRSFAEAHLHDIIDRDLMKNSTIYQVDELRSSVFYNTKSGFIKEPLPLSTQFSPVHSFQILDLNEDTSPDVIAAGNFLHANIQRGRYDAGYGTILKNNGKGKLYELPNKMTNWFIEGQVRNLRMIKIENRKVMIAAINDGTLQFFEIKK